MRRLSLLSAACVSMVCGCVSTTPSEAFSPSKEVVQAATQSVNNGTTNFQLGRVTHRRERFRGMETGAGWNDYYECLERGEWQSWPALEASIKRKLMLSQDLFTAPVIVVDIDVDETITEESGNATSTLLWCFTLGFSPLIMTENHNIELTLNMSDMPLRICGSIRRDTWVSWLTLPMAFVPKGEDEVIAGILSNVVVSELTKERYDLAVSVMDERRRREEEAAEKARMEREKEEAERKAREEAMRIAREKAEAEQRTREEEARLIDEKAERFWEENKDNPMYRFPLRGDFPDSVKIYKDFYSGCSLEWATNYISRDMSIDSSDVERRGVFLAMAKCMESQWTERPLPDSWSGIQTESSLFVCNPTNIVFWEDGRYVSLTFGELPGRDGKMVRVLVGGELFFEDGMIPVESLADKYRREVPGMVLETMETASDFGVSAELRCFRVDSVAGGMTSSSKVKILNVERVKAQEKHIKSATASAIEKAANSDSLYDAAIAASTVELAIGLDILVGGASDATKRENLTRWNNLCNKPVVSIVDIPLFHAMSNAKETEDSKFEEKRRAAEEAVENARKEELRRRIESF